MQIVSVVSVDAARDGFKRIRLRSARYGAVLRARIMAIGRLPRRRIGSVVPRAVEALASPRRACLAGARHAQAVVSWPAAAGTRVRWRSDANARTCRRRSGVLVARGLRIRARRRRIGRERGRIASHAGIVAVRRKADG